MSSNRLDDETGVPSLYVQTPSHTVLHLLAQMQRASDIAEDLRLQPLIRRSLLTLEPVDHPPDEYGYDASV